MSKNNRSANGHIRKETCQETTLSLNHEEQNVRDPIHIHTHTRPGKGMFAFTTQPATNWCPLMDCECLETDCRWYHDVEAECSIYKIARCIL